MSAVYSAATGFYLVGGIAVALALGLCVFADAYLSARDLFAQRQRREAAFLRDWYLLNAGVGAAHGDRSTARHPHAHDAPSAAGYSNRDETPARHADGFYAAYGRVFGGGGE